MVLFRVQHVSTSFKGGLCSACLMKGLKPQWKFQVVVWDVVSEERKVDPGSVKTSSLSIPQCVGCHFSEGASAVKSCATSRQTAPWFGGALALQTPSVLFLSRPHEGLHRQSTS